MRKNKEVTCWCIIQEHYLEAFFPWMKTLGEVVLFYAYGEDGLTLGSQWSLLGHFYLVVTRNQIFSLKERCSLI